jgi:lauroyl/myristoyl acyltransferase
MTTTHRPVLEGRKALVVGIANDQSIAYGCARAFRDLGADLAVTHLNANIRLPGGRFQLDLTEAIPMPRDAEGRVDVDAATAAMNAVVEGWIREHPGQWLWMHRRWRN